MSWPRRTLIPILAFLAAAALMWVGAHAGTAAARVGCPGENKGRGSATAQEQTMLCLVNQTRTSHGLPPLTAARSLVKAADHKSRDILRCGAFSHEACDREFTYWMTHFGYRGCAEGENIAWGSGGLGTPVSIFRAWMHSQGHRENILGPYEDTGIGLQTGKLEGVAGAHVWTQEFGAHNC